MQIYVKLYLISIFFSDFNHDFIIYIDYTHIADSNTESDDFTKFR